MILKNPQGSLCGFFFSLTAKNAKNYFIKKSCKRCKTFAVTTLQLIFKKTSKKITFFKVILSLLRLP
jgi:hypothetical protein